MGDPIERFDQFVEQWHQMGGAEIMEEVNAWAAQNQ
jgi:putative aldouronate transport system substrate-binding protein